MVDEPALFIVCMGERNIRLGNYCWLENAALDKISELPYGQRHSVQSVYLGLCKISSRQKNTPQVVCYKFDIASQAYVSEKTVQRCLPILEELQLVSISPQDRKSNGKFEKIKITLVKATPTAGQHGDSTGTARGQHGDTESDIIQKEEIQKEEIEQKKKFKLYRKESLEYQAGCVYTKKIQSISLFVGKASNVQEAAGEMHRLTQKGVTLAQIQAVLEHALTDQWYCDKILTAKEFVDNWPRLVLSYRNRR